MTLSSCCWLLPTTVLGYSFFHLVVSESGQRKTAQRASSSGCCQIGPIGNEPGCWTLEFAGGPSGERSIPGLYSFFGLKADNNNTITGRKRRMEVRWAKTQNFIFLKTVSYTLSFEQTWLPCCNHWPVTRILKKLTWTNFCNFLIPCMGESVYMEVFIL